MSIHNVFNWLPTKNVAWRQDSLWFPSVHGLSNNRRRCAYRLSVGLSMTCYIGERWQRYRVKLVRRHDDGMSVSW